MEKSPSSFDRIALGQARTCYEEAHSIDRFDLYAALNLSRLELLLSKWDFSKIETAKKGFAKYTTLCQFAVADSPDDYWRKFDLMDSLLFSGCFEEAIVICDTAISSTPKEERNDILTSVVKPITDLIAIGLLDDDTLSYAKRIEQKLKEAIANANSH